MSQTAWVILQPVRPVKGEISTLEDEGERLYHGDIRLAPPASGLARLGVPMQITF